MQARRKEIGLVLLEFREGNICEGVVVLLKNDSTMYIHISSLNSVSTFSLMYIYVSFSN